VIYTDGITEATSVSGEEYGRERFAECILDCRDLSAKEMIESVRNDVAEFTERKLLDDDGTIFVVKAN
jgi:sigma-B regulation protein RsbU (phosphoserine phosphatase)